MLSRVADNLYWMSRYLERAEHTARLIDLNLYLALELSPELASAHWQRLLASLRVALPPDVPMLPFQLTHRLTFEPSNADSLVSCVAIARENARQVREQISSEMWEQINQLYLRVKRAAIDQIWNAQPHEFFRAVKEGAHLFQGITDSTLSHAEGWRFIQLGRFIERARATAMLLDVHFSGYRHSDDAGPADRSFCAGSASSSPARRLRHTASSIPPICGPKGASSSCCSMPNSRARFALPRTLS
jgi:uncharacterized alpha-E superfamily protein